MWLLEKDKKRITALFPGVDFLFFDKTGSTNDILKSVTPIEGRAVCAVAKEQTGGRGRRGRSFLSPTGGLYLSYLAKPHNCGGSDIGRLTAGVAAAVALSLEEAGVRDIGIKWINDLFLGEKKIAGILCEGAFGADGQLNHAVIGIGINLERQNFGELSDIATDIESECGFVPKISELIPSILSRLDALCQKESSLDEYKKRLISRGAITVTEGERRYTAEALGIDSEARLIVKTEDGTVKHLVSAEVSVSRKG